MRKLISMLLVLTLVLGMAVSVSAAGQSSNIVIGNASTSGLYKAYKVLDAAVDTTTDASRDAITYSLNAIFAGFFLPNGTPDGTWLTTTAAEDATIVTYGDATYYLNVTEDNVATLAEELAAYVDTNKISFTKTAGANEAYDEQGNSLGNRATFSGMDFGYYLIESPVGTVYMLASNNEWTLIEEKNTAPTLTKQVTQLVDGMGYLNAYSDTISASHNSTGAFFKYKVQVTVGTGATNYQIYDRFDSKNLTYNGYELYYKAPSAEKEEKLTENVDYTYSYTYGDIESLLYIKITNEALLVDGAIITLYTEMYAPEYLPTTGAVNKAFLVYGDNQSTPTETATVYSSQIEILKYADGNTTDVLADAVFVLSDITKTSYGVFSTVSNPAGGSPRKTFSWTTSKASATPFTTGEDGKVTISGIPNGTYYLEEITAPDGYNLLAEPVMVEVKSETDDPNAGVVVVKEIENKSGAVLPSTGGMGTTLFYVLGSLMAVTALVVLVTNKRMRT